MSVKQPRRFPTIAQWREVGRFLTIRERRSLAGASLIALLCAGTLSWSMLQTNLLRVPAVGGEYSEVLLGNPRYINPLYAVASDVDGDLTRLIFSGLMRKDADGNLLPDLAESINTQSSTSATITLRDATFHDGDSVTADDIVFTYNALKNPEYGSPLQGQYKDINVEAVDDHTLTLTTSGGLTIDGAKSRLTVGILPAHLWETVQPSTAPLMKYNLQPIGTGPYQFYKVTYDPDNGLTRSMVLVRNTSFYREGPYIERITVKFGAASKDVVDIVRSRQTDGAATVPTETGAALKDAPGVTVYHPELPQYVGAFFNAKKAGPLTDINVRQALSKSLDRSTIATKARAGLATPYTSPLLPNLPGATEILTQTTPEDGNALLDQAGYVKGEDGMRKKGETALAVTITVAEDTELRAAADEIARTWNSLGVKADVVQVPKSAINDILTRRDFDIVIVRESVSVAGDLFAFWHSGQGTAPGMNLSGWVSKNADDALLTLRTSTDQKALSDAGAKLAAAFAAEAPAAILYIPQYPYVTAKDIQGISLKRITTPADRFNDIARWYLKTRLVRAQK